MSPYLFSAAKEAPPHVTYHATIAFFALLAMILSVRQIIIPARHYEDCSSSVAEPQAVGRGGVVLLKCGASYRGGGLELVGWSTLFDPAAWPQLAAGCWLLRVTLYANRVISM